MNLFVESLASSPNRDTVCVPRLGNEPPRSSPRQTCRVGSSLSISRLARTTGTVTRTYLIANRAEVLHIQPSYDIAQHNVHWPSFSPWGHFERGFG